MQCFVGRPVRQAGGDTCPAFFVACPWQFFFLFRSVYDVRLLLRSARSVVTATAKFCSCFSVFRQPQMRYCLKTNIFSFPLVVSAPRRRLCSSGPNNQTVVASRLPSSSGCSTKLTTTTTGTYITQSSSRRLLRRTVRRWRTSDWRRPSTSWTWTTPGTSRGIT